MNDPRPMLSLDTPPPQTSASKWGIAAILGLTGLLGVMVQQRFSDADRNWARWEKHELTGVVLGQSPDQPAATAPARRSSAPPLWAQAQNSREESHRSPRELTTSVPAPAQVETSRSEENDPFASPHARPVNTRSEAPRVLFEGENPDTAKLPARQPGQGATPAALDFAVSDLSHGQAGQSRGRGSKETRSDRYQHVQQVAGTEQPAEVAFPEPVPFNQMPISAASEAREHLPSLEQNSTGLPEVGMEPAAKHHTQPTPSQQFFAEPTLSEPQPTLNMSARQQQQPQELPALGHEARMPAQSMERETMPLHQPEPVFSTPNHQFQQQQQQMLQPHMNQPVPATPPRQQSVPPATAGTTQSELPPDEVYQVQAGDNYWTISRKYYSSARFFSALAEYNKHRIPNPEKMKPGMYVLVPHVEVLHQQYPQLTGGGPRDPAETAPAGFFVDANGQPSYRVGKGDTLTDIAQAYLGRSSRWVQIQGMNQDRLTDGKTLKIGTVLRLPADASQVVLAPSDSEIR